MAKKLLVFLVLSLIPLLVSAESVEINGIYYNLFSDTKTAEVTKNPNKYTGDVVIPENIVYSGVEYSVTSIGAQAFDGCSKLTSVTIPNSVISIGWYAFADCWRLNSITIPNSVTSIGVGAFYHCSGLTSIFIPSSVTSFGRWDVGNDNPHNPFYSCGNLTSITVDENNPRYDSRNNCNAIIDKEKQILITGCKNTIIPNGVKKIGNAAFDGCYDLKSITIPNSVTSFEYESFSGCSSLTSFEIPNSVTKIDERTFSNCQGLTSITIPSNVKSIGGDLFSSCRNLISIIVEDGNAYYDSRNNCNAIIEKSTNKLIAGCKTTTIPNSVASIGYNSMCGFSDITSIIIPNSVTEICFGAFQSCGLTSITIPNSVTNIGESAFAYCSGLTNVISEIQNPFEIKESVFSSNTYSKATLTVPSSTKTKYQQTNYWNKFTNIIESSGGGSSTSRTIHVYPAGSLPSLISETEKYTIEELTLTGELNGTDFRLLRDMAGCNYLGEETVGKLKVLDFSEAKIVTGGEKYVDTDLLPGLSGSFHYTIKKADELPENLFHGCKFLSISLPTTIKKIGIFALMRCVNLTSITIPNSVTRIESWAFNDCYNLPSIIIPNSVTYISGDVFNGCYALASVNVESGNTIYDSRNNCNAIIRTSDNVLIAGCKNTVIPSSVTAIGDYAFMGCRNMTSIKIPNSVTTIGYMAFYGCTGLTSITIPNSVTSIEADAFYYCWSLPTITIPKSVTSIGRSAFWGCSGLTSIISGIVNPFEISENVFSNYSTAILTVPSGTKSVYQSTAGWNKFTNIQEDDSQGTPETIAEVVDLGLSVKWASWNVGADKPEGLGNLYAWGELSPKTDYSASTYKFYNNSYTKYGSVDNKYRLDSEDDVAQQNWGDKWRMPTFEELKELKEKCTFTETELNGVPVTKVTGPNGNFIYFPYPGNFTGTYLYFKNSIGSYWSSDLESDSYAKDLDFGYSEPSLNGDTRYHGQSIRPVYGDNNDVPHPNGTVPDVVDLGLTSGTLWAAWNIGASTPEEYGTYFAWGETAPKGCYDWSTYKFGDGSNFSKYNSTDGLTELELEDDAAYVILGKDWRMPTHKEELELVNECSWESVTVNGISGYKITGPNGNSIFMPRGGLYDGTDYSCDGTKLSNVNTCGWYWSSTLNAKGSAYAQGLCFFPSLLSNVSDHERCDGHNIRPVYVGYSNDPDPQTVVEVTDVTNMANAIYVEPLRGSAGSDVNIKVKLKNANSVTSYGFELVLPAGVTISTSTDGSFDDAVTMSTRHKGHTLTTNKLANNTYKVGVASLSSKALTDNDGLVLTIQAHVADNIAKGEYAIGVQSPLIVNADGTKPAVQSTQSKITIEDYTKGDVDGDGVIDLADAVLVINHYVGKPVAKFNEKAADVDGDGVIDLADAVRIINFYVGKVQSLAPGLDLDGLDPQ